MVGVSGVLSERTENRLVNVKFTCGRTLSVLTAIRAIFLGRGKAKSSALGMVGVVFCRASVSIRSGMNPPAAMSRSPSSLGLSWVVVNCLLRRSFSALSWLDWAWERLRASWSLCSSLSMSVMSSTL